MSEHLDSLVGTNLSIYDFVCFCYGNIYAFRSRPIIDFQTIYKSLRSFLYQFYLYYLQQVALTGAGLDLPPLATNRASTAEGGNSPRSAWFFPQLDSFLPRFLDGVPMLHFGEETLENLRTVPVLPHPVLMYLPAQLSYSNYLCS